MDAEYYREEILSHVREDLQEACFHGAITRDKAEALILTIEEWFASHWQDNEHPTTEQAEVSFDYQKYPTVTFSD